MSEPVPIAPEDKPRRRRLGPAFWAGILFGLVCIFLGLVAGVWGARFTPPPLPKAPAVLPAEPAPAQPPSARRRSPQPAPETATAAPFDPASDTYALEQRLAEVEAQSRERTAAAEAALAVVALTQAADRGQPFAAEVEARRAALPASADLDALRAVAATGAPTRAALAAGFPAAAARGAAAARQAETPHSWAARLVRLLSGAFALRRTDRLTGPGVDATLARADRALARGDLSGAVREVRSLPVPAQGAMTPWPAHAERRLEIEQRLASLRSAALAGLGPPRAETGG